MLVELFSILLAISPAQSFVLGREAAASQATTVNCASVSCGANGGLRGASSFCASYTGSVVTVTTTPKYTTTSVTCGNNGASGSPTPTTTTTATVHTTTIAEPYCLHPAYPKSAVCSCLSIPSSYTVTVTATAPAATTFAGPFGLYASGDWLVAQRNGGADPNVYELSEYYTPDDFLLRQDGAIGDFTLVQDDPDGTPPPLAYQPASEKQGGLVYFNMSMPIPKPQSLINCAINSTTCGVTCSGHGGPSGFYLCSDGVELTTPANAAAESCRGPLSVQT